LNQEASGRDLDALRRLATYSALLAIVLSVPSTIAFVAAFGWDVEAMLLGHPEAILGGGGASATLLRWGAILDMFYSYLLLVPLALFLHRRLRPRKPWLADLGTAGAFAYIVVGASGAAILGTTGPTLVEAYGGGTPADQAAIGMAFGALRDTVYFALWQTLDPITAGTWVLSVGWLLLVERPLVGRLLIVLGIGAFAFSVMTVLGIHSLAVLVALFVAIVLVWGGWVLAPRGRAGEARIE
jgi:uncharacterized protein DUF4386